MAPKSRAPLALITGANTGIGFQTAARLAQLGYDVIIACRSVTKGREAAEAIGSGASFMQLDLSSLKSTLDFVRQFRERHEHLHVLVTNAGMNTMGSTVDERRAATDTGFEQCFQVNFLAQFELTLKLLPLMKTTAADVELSKLAPVRIVTLSSVTHWLAASDTSIKWAEVIRGTDSASAYGLSKLAAILFAKELTRRLEKEGMRGRIKAIAVNPGGVNSNIWRTFGSMALCLLRPVMGVIFLTTEQGSDTSVVAATAEVDSTGRALTSGQYLTPYYQLPAPAPEALSMLTESLGPFAGARIGRSSAISHDALLAAALWRDCESAIAEWKAAAAAAATR